MVENNATLEQTYNKHKEIFIENGVNFDSETLFLKSHKKHIEDLLKNEENHPYILEFFNDMDNFDSSMKDKYPTSYFILKELRDVYKFKYIFIRNDEIRKCDDFTNECDEDEKYGKYNFIINVYSKFRKNITRIIKNYLKTHNSHRNDLMVDMVDADDFYWLRFFYPQVKLLSFYVNSNFKIKRLYLTFHKFISPLSLVFPITNIASTIDYDFINNANIFIDEADQTHDIILEKYAEESIKFFNVDYLGDVINIFKLIQQKDLIDFEGDEKIFNSFKNLKHDINDLFSDYEGNFKENFYYNYLESEIKALFYMVLDKKKAYDKDLFKNFYFYFEKGRGYVILSKNDREQNAILKNKYNLGYEIYNMFELIEKIEEIFEEFISFLLKQISYFKNKDDKNKKDRVDNRDGYIKSALSSFCQDNSTFYNFLLDVLTKRFLTTRNFKIQRKEKVFDNALYKGFSYYFIENNSYNLAKSVVKKLSLNYTPEYFLYNLSTKANVFLLSATADLTGMYSNYYIELIRKFRGEDEIISSLTDFEEKSLKKELDRKTDLYCDINIQSEKIGDDDKDVNDFYESLISGDNSILEYYKDVDGKKRSYINENIKLLEKDSYAFSEFKKLIYAIYKFFKNGGESGVFIQSANLKDNMPKSAKISFLCIVDICECIVDRHFPYLKDKYVLKNTKASTYDNDFDDLQNAFNKNKKTLMFTTYKNIMTGKNLSFKIDGCSRLFKKPNTNGIYNENYVDFNFMCFGPVTHLGILPQNCGFFGSERQINTLKYTYQLEKGVLMGYGKGVNKDYKDRKIQALLDKKENLKEENNIPHLERYLLGSKNIAILQNIKQSIGRISRNNLKEKNIILIIDEKNYNACKDYYDENKMSDLNLVEFRELMENINTLKKQININDFILGADDKSKELFYKLDLITSNSDHDIRHDKDINKEYRFFKMENVDLFYRLFPFFENKDKAISILGEDLYNNAFVEISDNKKNIYATPLNGDHTHSLVKSSKCSNVIGFDTFINDIKNDYKFRSFITNMGYDLIALENKSFKIFPTLTMFNNIVKGNWGEILIGNYLKESNFNIKELDFPIYETFDAEITGFDTKIYVDYKNWIFSKKDNLGDIIKKTLYKESMLRKTTGYTGKILVFYINLYNREVNTAGNGLIHISNGIDIFDLGSLYYKNNGRVSFNKYLKDDLIYYIDGVLNGEI